MAANQDRAGRPLREELVFMALGGIGEIGMNCYLYGLGPADDRQWLMVDLGITFPEGENDPGVDVILPDLRFIEAERRSLAGLVLTHAHEDHFGAVIELWPRLQVPVYATPFTAELLKAKLAEYGRGAQMPIREVALNSRFDVGPFDVELVSVAHSIPESNALAIRTPLGLVLHSGDWKFDPTPVIGAATDTARLAALAAEGVTAMVCDSTNAMREGRSPSERDVAQSLARIVKDAKRRVAVTIFASNVARLRAVADAARAAGRQLVVAGRAMHRIIDVAISTGHLPQGFKYLDQDQFKYLQAHEVVALCTGSQGEPRAAMARIAADEHPDISLDRGDLVIFSSRTIPGNERAVGEIQNRLVDMGCNIVTDGDALVHVTGHPRREELKEMYALVKPRIVIPMHGEARHLAEHAKLAKAAGHQGGGVGAQRRHRAADAGSRRDHRRGAGRPAVPRRPSAGAERGGAGARAAIAGVCGRGGRGAAALGPRRGRAGSGDRARWRAPAGCRRQAHVGDRARRGGGHHRQHSARATPGPGAGARGRAPGGQGSRRRRLGQAADRQGAADAGAALNSGAAEWTH